jgi:hypothetical protein
MLVDELQRLHSGALQLKQQSILLIDCNQLSLKQQMLSSDVLIEELQHVYSGALRLTRQSMMLIDFNKLSLRQQTLFIDAMLIDELSTVVVAFELPPMDNDALHLTQ